MATTYHNAIQKLYVAYFNRPADYAGLNYWEGVVEAAAGSTAAVSAAFAGSAEYQAEYGSLSNAQVVNQIYTNLFGRSAEPDGIAYWSNLLTTGAITVDIAVTQIAAGAQGTDLIAYNSKVAVATAFTNALDTPAEQTGYTGDLANEAAKEFLSTIKTAADVTANTTPAALADAIDDVLDAATPFELISALEALDAAQDARDEFVEDNGNAASLDADVLTAAQAFDATITGYSTSSAGVRAALLADEQADLADALEAAQGVYDDAAEAVAEVDGLTEAVAAAAAAATAEEEANDTFDTETGDLAGAVAVYNTYNAAAVITGDGEIVGVIELNDDDELEIVSGVTETNHKGVTALLAAINAYETAEANLADASDAFDAADLEVSRLDLGVADLAALEDIAAAMTIVDLDADELPSSAQISVEIAGLTTLAVNARAAANAAPADAALDLAADNAETAQTNFQALIDAFDVAALANDPLTDALEDAQTDVGGVDDATAAVDALAAMVEDQDAALALVAELDALEAAIDDAEAEFSDNDMNAPITLAAYQAGTSGADIFVAGSTAMAATVAFFGDSAAIDSLFIGTGYVLNKTATTLSGIATAGDNAKLEVFAIQSGTSVKLYVEQETFGSASAAEAEQVITLTGITIAELTMSNGILTA